ncbi:MAG: LysE family transporter [Chloroflexi bacterium]|jgi:threonine/homoserine/homoserine lactone efflux protein|nr:LysE family transporter [Chloroflexota bacterium]
MTASLGLFLLSAAGISLSGVMLPGPLTAATIAKGYREQNAGIFIALGHAVIELPLMALIYFGFAHFFASPEAKKVIGLAGGLMLIAMGSVVVWNIKKAQGEAADLPYNSLVTGIMMTGANPYFFLWWATIGIALIATAAGFGIWGLVVFAVVHWSCDLVWEQFISMSVFRTKHLWTQKVQRIVFGVCALVLVGFGVWFCVSVFV